jgi:hypothetical protein
MAVPGLLERPDATTLAPLLAPQKKSGTKSETDAQVENGSFAHGTTVAPLPDHDLVVRNLPIALPRETDLDRGQAAGVESRAASRSGSSVLDEATAALRRLAVEDSSNESDWAAAARLLRTAAQDRRLAAPRVASVALLASDAIMFTPRDLALEARAPLIETMRLLVEPFVSGDAEERVFDSFLDAGWEVTPFHEEDGDELSDL